MSVFYFNKGEGEIDEIGIAKLKKAFNDNPQAAVKLQKSFPKDVYRKELNIEKLVAAFKLYNK
ncbi:MAG: hypothetical protein ABIR81_11400 [Ginsengibacter sp.]